MVPKWNRTDSIFSEANDYRQSKRNRLQALGLTMNFSLLSNPGGKYSVKTLTPVHPLLKVGKPWKIWWIFGLQYI
jgi:hypothetical protein